MKCRKCKLELLPGQLCTCSVTLPQTDKKERTTSLIEKMVAQKSKKNISRKVFPGCYIECFPFPAIQLTKNNKLRIGRGPENDLILTSNDVSRRHANIYWDNEIDQFAIEDLESQNGVTVNKEHITNCLLTNNDIIGIGANNISYYEISESQQTVTNSSFETISVKANLDELLAKFRSSLNGHLGILELSSVLQMIAGEQKTGCIKIEDEDEFCFIYFQDGLIIHSIHEDIYGLEAFYQIMEWRIGYFEFIPDKKPQQISMQHELQFLLMEAARRIDEKRK